MKIKIKVTYNTSYCLKEMVTKAGCILFFGPCNSTWGKKHKHQTRHMVPVILHGEKNINTKQDTWSP
jgi:hypothetical protein